MKQLASEYENTLSSPKSTERFLCLWVKSNRIITRTYYIYIITTLRFYCIQTTRHPDHKTFIASRSLLGFQCRFSTSLFQCRFSTSPVWTPELGTSKSFCLIWLWVGLTERKQEQTPCRSQSPKTRHLQSAARQTQNSQDETRVDLSASASARLLRLTSSTMLTPQYCL